MRIIPGKTKVRIEIFKGITLADMLIGLAFIAFAILAITSPMAGRVYVAGALLFIGALLLARIGDEPNYMFFLSFVRHMSYRKEYAKGTEGKDGIQNITSFKGIEDGFIVYPDYYGAVIEIPPVEFRFLSAYRRTITIDDCLGNVLRSVSPNYAANLVKIERRVPYDGYIKNERAKLDDLRNSYEYALISEEEYQAKCEVIFDRLTELESMNTENRTVAPYFYLVLFESDKNQLRLQVDTAISTLKRGEMQPKRLDSKGLALFLKYNYDLDFDEKELDGLKEEEYAAWAMPDKLSIRANNYVLDDITAYTMIVNSYPLRVGDAWLATVMSIPATKVVVKLQPMDKGKVVKNIDHSISELRARYNQSGVDSTLMELASHIESLGQLLAMLQSDNEVLLNTNVYVTCYDVSLTKKEGREQVAEKSNRATINNMRAVIRRNYREDDLRLASLQFNQVEAYIGAQISGYDPFAKSFGRGIPGATAAAMYPWVFAHVQDPQGVKLGAEDGIPVFIDMFRRDSERVNSNMVIVGKSGSGKSYAAKSLLVNLAADNSKIFVLDPENEYTELADNLHGKFINVGNAQQGRMNPFQIITALDDDTEGESGVTGSYASHMQFLEEFFRQILPDCDKDALEYLNTIADRVYMNRGITEETNLSTLTATDYPTFDDLYDEILKEFQSTDNEYLRSMLRTLMNYISKFSAGGRNANIWNGPSTISTDENFTVFNFQSLLAGGNQMVTNAQMLLVMKYIDNEIIKNRDYNNRYGTNRKIVVVIDEAHVFIDEKYPIALDFMFQLAKRIRKYNGMQIVITQNIKDFVGSEELSRKSSAIINACQYSFIFPLAPNDMSDLCKLYEKAGGINENEQNKIVTAPRGNAFVILSSSSRSSFQVEVPNDVIQVFRIKNLGTRYFKGTSGQKAWDDFVGASRAKYLENRKIKTEEEESEAVSKPKRVSLVELTEEEYELEQSRNKPIISFEELPPVTKEAEKSEEQAPAQIPVAPQPQVIIRETAPDNSGMTEMVSELRRMMESVGRFSYDAMISDIMSRLGTAPAFAAAAAPVAAPAAPVASAVSPFDFGDYEEPVGEAPAYQEPESSEESEEDVLGSFNFLDLFGDDESKGTGSRSTAGSSQSSYSYNNYEEEDEDDSGKTLEDYLREMAIEAEDMYTGDEEEEESEGSSFESSFSLFGSDGDSTDILSFIEKAAAELESVSVLDEMINNGETKRVITLDELTKLNEMRKNK